MTLAQITFETSFNLGTMVSIGLAASGLAAFLWTIRGDLNVIVERMKFFEGTLETFDTKLGKLADAMIMVARQEERINALEKRMVDSQAGIDLRFSDMQDRMMAMIRAGDVTPAAIKKRR